MRGGPMYHLFEVPGGKFLSVRYQWEITSLCEVAPGRYHYYSVPSPSATGVQVQALSNPMLYIYKGQSVVSPSTGLSDLACRLTISTSGGGMAGEECEG